MQQKSDFYLSVPSTRTLPESKLFSVPLAQRLRCCATPFLQPPVLSFLNRFVDIPVFLYIVVTLLNRDHTQQASPEVYQVLLIGCVSFHFVIHNHQRVILSQPLNMAASTRYVFLDMPIFSIADFTRLGNPHPWRRYWRRNHRLRQRNLRTRQCSHRMGTVRRFGYVVVRRSTFQAGDGKFEAEQSGSQR